MADSIRKRLREIILRVLKIIIFLALLVISGCASPALRVDRLAEDSGFSRQVIRGKDFNHLVYFNQKYADDGTLHIYLEGDGSPWINHVRPSPDPTPRSPLMLRLMALDRNGALYLGRPCYYGFQDEPGCNQWLWTFGRYSPQVIDQMSAALENILLQFPEKELVFMGHSGGAVLAVFLAERFKTRAVVTISGLLDTDEWVKLHGYSPLVDSMNPATQSSLSSNVIQLHFSGSEDTNIPAEVNSRYRLRFPQAAYMDFPGVDHLGWESKWPDILENLQQKMTGSTL
jgi:pimeloyl-ACP methyl ester carboxylesterase